MFRQIALAVGVVLVLTFSPSPAPATARSWAPVDIGALGSAWDINEQGQVVGGADRRANGHAFLWQAGSLTDLGTLGGTWSEAHAINGPGQVVGVSTTTSGEEHAFLWQVGRMTDLGTLGGTWSYPYDINGPGQVVGVSSTTSGERRAFLWQDGKMTDLGDFGARAINDLGQMVGTSSTASGEYHASLWSNGQVTDLGTLGGILSEALGLNERGQVVGDSTTASGEYHAFLWQDGAMTDLGQRVAHAVNDRGQIVGMSKTSATPTRRHAVLWQDGAMTDLGSQVDGWSEALAINDRGQVVGDGGGEFYTHAVLWPDAVAPEVAAPVARPHVGSAIGTSVPTTVSWSATDLGSGVDLYQLQQQADAGPWRTVGSTLGRSVIRDLVPGVSYRFRVRAWDAAGNVSGYQTGPAIRLTRYEGSSPLVLAAGSWRTQTTPAASGRSTRYATANGATATLTVTGSGVAWMAAKGPTRGTAQVYVDGIRVTNVSLYARTTLNKVIVYSIRWSTVGPHTVKLVVLGTAGHPRVDVDAFIVTR